MVDYGPEDWAEARADMVRNQLAARGLRDPRVLAALGRVPRERFVPPDLRAATYWDHPLPIGPGQTISQPYIVAVMAEALGLEGRERVLEIGSGSGYATAVLAELVPEVWGIELDAELVRRARAVLAGLGLGARIHLQAGDGALGWPGETPFDAILLSCAAPRLPAALTAQLAPGGRIVLPEGGSGSAQTLVRLTRRPGGWDRTELLPVRFVPLRPGH